MNKQFLVLLLLLVVYICFLVSLPNLVPVNILFFCGTLYGMIAQAIMMSLKRK